eukprot:TRINITY_DN8278_c0_g1_i8.p1 TRINITY_DN8278_c0_g1~~TRINITY_DN8278_c0_g1_i8.p1  ORF type:complete len:156 (-),score=52.88 TRINITY_DN8278_c0_g1_i8:567-1034(-)
MKAAMAAGLAAPSAQEYAIELAGRSAASLARKADLTDEETQLKKLASMRQVLPVGQQLSSQERQANQMDRWRRQQRRLLAKLVKLQACHNRMQTFKLSQLQGAQQLYLRSKIMRAMLKPHWQQGMLQHKQQNHQASCARKLPGMRPRWQPVLQQI